MNTQLVRALVLMQCTEGFGKNTVTYFRKYYSALAIIFLISP